ncbi:putative het-s domain protein [Diaporthe ampelina]|uniref:Putative het-s domain protein n=1 Tax=Diaporthe ampelina TaxID=1214573 RepID=A0A0G2I8M3_9PEZI|nr:putative het-s domain protein [Diaporthe ampelina]
MESYGIPQGGYQLPVQRRLSRLYNDTKKSSDFVKEPVQNAEDPDIKSLHRKLKIQNDRLVTWGLEWSDPGHQDIIDDSLSKAGLSEVVGSIMSTIKEILAEAEPLWASSRRQAGGLPPLGDKKIPIVAWDKARFEDLPIPMSETTPDVHPRDIVYMSKQAYSDLTRNNGRPYTALLLEHAEFDPMYSATGIMPDMSRFEKLSAGLQTEPQRSPGSWTGLPQLLGYFEDMDNSRLGLVYHFPPGFNPISYEPLTHNTLNTLCSLSDLLARPDFEPTLEAKFRLAYNLANTVFDMHARGITHGNLTNSSISFCKAVGVEPGMGAGEVDIRRPLISSFDLFPESFQEGSTPTKSLYRHPLDPKTTAQQSLLSNSDSKAFDVYSLGMLLLSIGMWTNLENLVSSPSATSVPEVVLEQLATSCGTLYMKAVQTCRNAVDEELAAGTESNQVMTRVQVSASRYLEVCAILDSVGGLEDRLSSDLGIQSSSKQAGGQKSDKAIASSSRDGKAPPASTELRAKRSTKSRLYPHTPLPPEAVEHWNAVLMPQINQALRHFYRKNPESVEISLESIGETAKETTPTVLVVCTSVSKVKTILRRKMGALFDGTTGFALKVCRGQVLRSRNQVSFGGLVVVDEKTYGMTVHHMLDDPETSAPEGPQQPLRSGAGSENQVPDLAAWYAQQYPEEDSPNSGSSSDTEDFAAEFSDDGSDAFTESAVTSEYSDEEPEEDQYGDTGDIPGVEPGCGEGYVVSQPALDDVEEGFFASPDTQDEEHLDTFSLGEVFASSGIRRRHDDRGLVHEIDWALFEFKDDRLPNDNTIPVADNAALQPIHPTSVVPASSLPNLGVQCMARTSGLQTGVILPTLTSVKIYGRTSPSHTYQITSSPASERNPGDKPRLPLGLPGDSGAWIIERNNGQVCGHVLAWSQRKKVAYICPMDVLLLDIAETLEATEVRLPGGEPVVKMVDDSISVSVSERDEGYCEPQGDESDLDAELRSMAAAKRRSLRKGKGSVRVHAHDVAGEGGVDRASSVRSVPANRSSALGEIEQDLSRLTLGNKEAEARCWRA